MYLNLTPQVNINLRRNIPRAIACQYLEFEWYFVLFLRSCWLLGTRTSRYFDEVQHIEWLGEQTRLELWPDESNKRRSLYVLNFIFQGSRDYFPRQINAFRGRWSRDIMLVTQFVLIVVKIYYFQSICNKSCAGEMYFVIISF